MWYWKREIGHLILGVAWDCGYYRVALVVRDPDTNEVCSNTTIARLDNIKDAILYAVALLA
jgi:hypothetical protein